MTIRTSREFIPWLGAGVLLVGLVQSMAVVPAMAVRFFLFRAGKR